MPGLEQRGKMTVLRLLPIHYILPAVAAACLLMAQPYALEAQSLSNALPDAPSALLFPAVSSAASGQPQNLPQTTPKTPPQTQLPFPPAVTPPSVQIGPVSPPLLPQPAHLLPCPRNLNTSRVPVIFLPASSQSSCQQAQLHLIVNTGQTLPLTSGQKGLLAIHAVTDPFNLLSILGFSAISVASNSHSAYGPGFAGWGRLSGYDLAEDIQGEFVGTYLIPSLVHEDPRYHRLPRAPMSRRIEHALLHTFVSQHDDGSAMPNYATLLNAPISAEISNLYVPGIATNGPATVNRVLVAYGTDPIGPLIAEFLPDIAKRIHVNILFEQQLLNRIALGSGAQSAP